MRISKIIFIFLILFAAVQFCFGQDLSPKAQLLDQFAQITCDDWRGRVDTFFVELQYDPTSTGYVLISSGKDSFKPGLRYKNIILGHAEFRKFNSERFIVIHVKKQEAGVEFWKAPSGAEKSPFIVEEWSKNLPSNTKPFVFGTTFGFPECHSFSPKNYADYLLANPNVQGHVVIYDNSIHQGKNDSKFWLRILTKDLKIPSKRLKVFYSKAKNDQFPGTEFWLVPKKKK